MKHTKVKSLLNSETTISEVNTKGWVRTFRNNQFIALNDGSTINNIQCVFKIDNTLNIVNGGTIVQRDKLIVSKSSYPTFCIYF